VPTRFVVTHLGFFWLRLQMNQTLLRIVGSLHCLDKGIQFPATAGHSSLWSDETMQE
jgi:hypothetical protein